MNFSKDEDDSSLIVYTPENAFQTIEVDGGVSIIGYVGYTEATLEEQENISIPPTIEGKKVVNIGFKALYGPYGDGGNKGPVKLKTVVIPDTVISIDGAAFGNGPTSNDLTLVSFGKNSNITSVAAGSIPMLAGGIITGPANKKSVIFEGKAHMRATWVDLQ